MLKYTAKITSDSVMEGMKDIQLYGQGKAVIPLFSEQFESLLFPELVKDAEAKDEASAQFPGKSTLRMPMNLATALARDAAYSHAGRRHIQGLGLHTDFRKTYELAKVALDAGL
jgi:hypothetical protein